MSDRICNHIIGLAISTIKDGEGKQRFEWTEQVKARQAGWGDDGIVEIQWNGPKYRYCPMCGVDLGEFRAGMRGFNDGQSN